MNFGIIRWDAFPVEDIEAEAPRRKIIFEMIFLSALSIRAPGKNAEKHAEKKA